MVKKILLFMNPIANLGDTNYSFVFALVANIILAILSEIYALFIAKSPMAVGGYIIFLNIAFIIYFSFRDGILGGLISVSVTILYYLYIIYTRHYTDGLLSSGIDSTVTFTILYTILAIVIGFLKQTIDKLIEKEANARIRLETILDQLPTGVIISNPLGIIEYINKEIHKLFAHQVKIGTPVDENFKKLFIDELTPKASSDSPSTQVIKTAKPSKVREFVFRKKDGSKLYTSSSAAPIKNKKGKVIAIASISHNITAEKEQEQQKDDFIKMASHELKTPLTSAKVFSQVLQKKLIEKNHTELTKLASRLETQIDKLILLVGDLLDISRIEKGKLEVHKEKFLVRPLVEEVIEDLSPISNHTLSMHWTTKLPVFGDKERIRQVLTNLVTNAIKYSPEKSTIIIGSQRKNSQIVVYVKDEGIGIAEGEQKKIFQRFYQVAEHSTYPGLGLGLYISSEIIKQHKGKMWLTSTIGKGSTFWFSLPIYKK